MPKPITPAEAGKILETCAAPRTDESSGRIRNALVADTLMNGGGAKDIEKSGRVSENVGKCVADTYAGKPESSSFAQWAGGITDKFQQAANGLKEGLVLAVEKGAPAVTNAVTGGTVDTLRKIPERTNGM